MGNEEMIMPSAPVVTYDTSFAVMARQLEIALQGFSLGSKDGRSLPSIPEEEETDSEDENEEEMNETGQLPSIPEEEEADSEDEPDEVINGKKSSDHEEPSAKRMRM